MMKSILVVGGVILVWALAVMPCLAVERAASKPLAVVVGTELIADIVRDLLADQADILTLIPAASCPGHHDARATDIAFISHADAILLHVWQQKQKPILDAITAADKSEQAVFITPAASWLMPENQIAASKEIFRIIAPLPGVDATAMEKRLHRRLEHIVAVTDACDKALWPYADTPVMAATMQADFVKRLGMNVVADYGRAEDMSPATLMRLAEEGKKADVQVVIDNMQSGGEAGAPLAGEMGAKHVVFSNFPLPDSETASYAALLRHNCEALAQALVRK
ncbi:MAG: metal ABC transporter substrate-binding protein [Desulfobulbaceae bacterium]|jgi:zinc transport system substrate-binding protein|nr:metal ABC transporter substrate-binding protein [Desulfobulbaceae bacterium]